MKIMLLSMVWLAISLLSGCSEPRIDRATAREQILEIHRAQREDHLNKSVKTLVGRLSEDYLSVSNGTITAPSRSENLERFRSYFNSVDFVKWDDLREPVIRFSDDGNLAYTFVEKEVVIRYEGENGNQVEERTRIAWTAVYRRSGDEWKIEHIASTNATPETKRFPSENR